MTKMKYNLNLNYRAHIRSFLLYAIIVIKKVWYGRFSIRRFAKLHI